MPGTDEKAFSLLEEMNANRSDKLDLSDYNRNRIKDKISYSTSPEDAAKALKEIFEWRLKDWEYDEIAKKLGW
ncbi:MAG: hypothetical protein QG606_471 [Patescibacteria group bacterium]|jgi:hypothetical protein|nr:hypothetical protein [Patescibacteria group bacterium]